MQRTGLLLAACVAGFALMGPALADNKPMPDNAREYIIWPADGQVISGRQVLDPHGAQQCRHCPGWY